MVENTNSQGFIIEPMDDEDYADLEAAHAEYGVLGKTAEADDEEYITEPMEAHAFFDMLREREARKNGQVAQ